MRFFSTAIILCKMKDENKYTDQPMPHTNYRPPHPHHPPPPLS